MTDIERDSVETEKDSVKIEKALEILAKIQETQKILNSCAQVIPGIELGEYDGKNIVQHPRFQEWGEWIDKLPVWCTECKEHMGAINFREWLCIETIRDLELEQE